MTFCQHPVSNMEKQNKDRWLERMTEPLKKPLFGGGGGWGGLVHVSNKGFLESWPEIVKD